MKKRILFVLSILVIVAIVCVVWCRSYFAYSQEGIYRAIPEGAIVISEHENLSGRAEDIMANRVMRIGLEAGGVDASVLDEAKTDSLVEAILEKFVSRNTLFAYCSPLSEDVPEAKIIVSWVGAYSCLMRFGLSFPGLDLEKIKDPRVGTIWVSKEEVEPGNRLSIIFARGLLIACISPEPTAVAYVARRVRRNEDVVGQLRLRLDGRDAQEDVLDRGWVEIAGMSLRYGLNFSDVGSLSGWVKSSTVIEGFDYPVKTEVVEEVLGAAGDAVVIVPGSVLESALVGAGDDIGSFYIQKEQASFTALCGGDYSGRLMGIRVPVLISGAVLAENADALDVVKRAITQSGFDYSNDISLVCTNAFNRSVILLDIKKGILRSQPLKDKMGFIVEDRWLYFSTNLGSLDKVLSSNDTVRRWSSEIPAGKSASACLWIDTTTTGKDVKDIIALYSIYLALGEASSASVSREQLKSITEWLEKGSHFKSCTIWLEPASEEMTARFKVVE